MSFTLKLCQTGEATFEGKPGEKFTINVEVEKDQDKPLAKAAIKTASYAKQTPETPLFTFTVEPGLNSLAPLIQVTENDLDVDIMETSKDGASQILDRLTLGPDSRQDYTLSILGVAR